MFIEIGLIAIISLSVVFILSVFNGIPLNMSLILAPFTIKKRGIKNEN